MAGDNNQMFAKAHGSTNGTGGPWLVNENSQIPITQKIAKGNFHQSFPDQLLEISPNQFQWQIKRFPLLLEKLDNLKRSQSNGLFLGTFLPLDRG